MFVTITSQHVREYNVLRSKALVTRGEGAILPIGFHTPVPLLAGRKWFHYNSPWSQLTFSSAISVSRSSGKPMEE